MTSEQFLDLRFDLPECGQWSELEAGQVINLQLPDPDHGNAIRNLSRMLAEFVHQGGPGYPCFGLGLVLRRGPDTLRFPAMSYFVEGPLFAEADREATETRPAWVVELASTPDRRGMSPARAADYLAHGVQLVWGIDPRQRTVAVYLPDTPSQVHGDSSTITGEPVLGGFSLQVSDLFTEPEWWTGGPIKTS